MTSLFVFSFYCKLMIFFFVIFASFFWSYCSDGSEPNNEESVFFPQMLNVQRNALPLCVPTLFLLFCFRLQLRRSQAPAPDCRSQNGFGENGPRAFVWGRSVFVSLIWPCNKECEKAAVTTGAEEKHRLCSHESAEREGPKVTEKALK